MNCEFVVEHVQYDFEVVAAGFSGPVVGLKYCIT